MIAQDGILDICATPENTETDPPGVHSYSKSLEVLANMDPVVVNVFYWSINDPEGIAGPYAIDEHSALESIQFLNIFYNPIGVYFKYLGWDSFNSPVVPIWKRYNYDCGSCVNYPFEQPDPCNSPVQTDPYGYSELSQCERYAMWGYAASNGHFNPNAMNVYVPSYGNVDFGGAAAGIPANKITSHRGGLTSNTFVHEMGHALGLSHTFPGWNSTNPHGCEHVTRDPNDLPDPNDPYVPYFNATERGDFVIDTPAMPSFDIEYCEINDLPYGQCSGSSPYRYFYIDANCNYIGTTPPHDRKDCQNISYEIVENDVRNMMTYSPAHCRINSVITTGQGIRIKEFLDTHSTLQPLKGTIASLYEPYKGAYYLAGPLPDDFKPALFQPGFSYMFKDCCCGYPQPSDFEDTSFTVGSHAVKYVDKTETDFETITHPNHAAFQILQLPSIIPPFRKCYDNWNKAAIGGSVTKFNDNIFNSNVTITAQDSTNINNPNLTNTLDPGLYKIEKVYEDGAVQQNVIYKNNNE